MASKTMIVLPVNAMTTVPNYSCWSQSSNSIQKKVCGGIKIVENYKRINSFSELVGPFKGDYLLIDLWATWCPPYKQEFSYSYSVFSFISMHRTRILFVYFDRDGQDNLLEKHDKYYSTL